MLTSPIAGKHLCLRATAASVSSSTFLLLTAGELRGAGPGGSRQRCGAAGAAARAGSAAPPG